MAKPMKIKSFGRSKELKSHAEVMANVQKRRGMEGRRQASKVAKPVKPATTILPGKANRQIRLEMLNKNQETFGMEGRRSAARALPEGTSIPKVKGPSKYGWVNADGLTGGAASTEPYKAAVREGSIGMKSRRAKGYAKAQAMSVKRFGLSKTVEMNRRNATIDSRKAGSSPPSTKGLKPDAYNNPVLNKQERMSGQNMEAWRRDNETMMRRQDQQMGRASGVTRGALGRNVTSGPMSAKIKHNARNLLK